MYDDKISKAVSNVYQDLDEIEGHIRFILDKVPSLDLDEETSSKIKSVCNNFYWTINDCKKELRTAEDKLGLHPNEAPLDPGSVNPDPRVNIGMLESFLSEDINNLKELVTTLHTLADKELLRFGTADILVTESAAHIINSYNKIREETKKIRMILDRTV